MRVPDLFSHAGQHGIHIDAGTSFTLIPALRSHRFYHFVNIDKYVRSEESLLPYTEMHPHTLNSAMYGFLDVNELPEQTGGMA